MGKTYLTPQQLSDRYNGNIKVRTLANWRCAGVGPKFTRAGGRILYDLDRVAEWEAQNTVNNTSQYRKS